ncbi:nitronate monooxygenase [Stieleria sp. ICT_E10.1]|uniref:nitronate monooxygenase n=1 Tax=Stieleria sedimenti TaxID=2976331 RepID=UPI00218011A9|nr:nitronate monooxygenase [Stieleria sedimenti]MCS7465871.1 nitronate monooxygenase [Stieleria sedimenti]
MNDHPVSQDPVSQDPASQAEPIIIQGGMGVAVSDWRLARSVSQTGQLGVVSGTAIDAVLVRRLQLGDAGGHMRRALAQFPYPPMAQRILDRYFIEGGLTDGAAHATTMVLSHQPTQAELELVVIANFVEVYLAKEDHDGLVGINYLEKIQTPTLPSLFGAMLADVDYVLMGAGIPRAIPGILDRLRDGLPVELPLHIVGAQRDDDFVSRFDPIEFGGGEIPWLHRPKFLAIVASATLATMLARKSSGRVDGFIVEGPTAGGHNAPPRGKSGLNDRGEPVYGARDLVDLDAIAALGLPFWLAGSYGSPERVREAIESGATGVQVGTAFAFCKQSGFRSDIKERIISQCRDGKADVVTDPLASPTGFPFKVFQIEGSLSDQAVFQQRQRVCDLGFLRQGYRKPDGNVGWRCPGEPIKSYLRKGGERDDTVGRKCVCNGLMASIGIPQRRSGDRQEQPLVTCGNDVAGITQFLESDNATSYTAADVVNCLLSASRVESTIV